MKLRAALSPHPARWSLVCLLAAAAACSDSPGLADQIEVISWWDKDGEAAALNALIYAFQETNPRDRVRKTIRSSSADARATIRESMEGGPIPDTFQANGGWDLLAWVLYDPGDVDGTKLEALANEDTAEWREAIPKQVLKTVQVDEKIYGVPLNVHRVNTMFFNAEVFRDAQVPVPTSADLPTIDHLFELLETLKKHGVGAPLAVGIKDSWTLGLMFFENILVARAGGDAYRTFFEGERDPLTWPELKVALADLSRLLSYANDDLDESSWDDALSLVRTKAAAVTIMGDWAKGYFEARRQEDGLGAEIGEMPMPGSRGTFVFTTDTFGLPFGAPNRDGALRFLRFAASKEGQKPFNLLKGSIPARIDISDYPTGQETMSDFKAAAATEDPTKLIPATAILAQTRYTDAVFRALYDFVAGPAKGNESVILYAFRNWSDVLRESPWP